MQARDIMTPDVICVAPDTPLADVVHTMLKHRISAVPVLEDGALVGIISEGDLLRRVETGTEGAAVPLAGTAAFRRRARRRLRQDARPAGGGGHDPHR